MRANHSVLQAHGPANTPYTSAVALAQNKLLVNTPLLVAEERGKPTCLVSAQMSETRTSREFGHFFLTFFLFFSANMFKICMLMFVCILYSSSELHMLAT